MSGFSSSTMETVRTLKEETDKKFEILQQENAVIREQNSMLTSQMSKLCQLLEGKQGQHPSTAVEASPPPANNLVTGEKRVSSSGDGLQ